MEASVKRLNLGRVRKGKSVAAGGKAGREGSGVFRELADLGRDRAIVYGWLFLGLQLAALAFLVLQSYGVIGTGRPGASTDFMMIEASGRLADSGTPALVYDLASQSVLQQRIFGAIPLEGFFPFYYPPIYLLICAPLALLPYLVGFAVWVLATGALFFGALWQVTRDWKLALALCSFPPAILNLAIGQNAFLTAALLGWGLVLIDRRPWLAGLVFGATSFKPHFLVLVPLALIAGRAWRALGGMVISVAVLTGASLLLFGVGTWRAFIESLPVAQAIYASGELGYWAQTSLFAAVRLLGGGYDLAIGVHAAAMLAAAGVTVYAWWNDLDPPTRAVALMAGTLICVPVNLSYDLLAAAVAVAFLCGEIPIRLAPWEKAIILGDWLIALLGRNFAQKFGVPILPLIALSLLGIAIARFNKRAVLPSP
jgi:alpha-1,2-mannosyltransferase